MANGMEGLMSLPQGAAGQGMGIDPELISPVATSYAQNNPSAFNKDMVAALGEADPALLASLRQELQALNLTQSEIDGLREALQRILRNPENYAEIRAELMQFGLDEEDLPPQFDGALFQAMAMALEEIRPAAEPMTMADGGLATLNPIAKELGSMGRYGDTMVAHINPREAAMLKAMGGSGTINPRTGLLEFGFLSKIWKGVKKAVKKVLDNPIGKIVATVALTMALGPAGIGFAGTATSITGLTGAMAVGVNAGLASTLVGVASGQSLADALKGGVISGITAGATAGLTDTLPKGYESGATEATTAAAAAPTAEVTVGTPLPETLPSPEVPTVQAPIEQTTVSPVTGQVTQATPANVNQMSFAEPVVARDVASMPKGDWTGIGRGVAPGDTLASSTIPSLEPVWDPNLGESTIGGVPASQYGANAPAPMPPTVEPIAPYNMTAEAAEALRKTAPALDVTKEGVMDLLSKGEYMEAAKRAGSNVFDFLDPRVDQDAINLRAEELAKRMDYKDALEMARSEAPGAIRRYMPLAATGLGIAGLAGGFEPEEPPESDLFKGPSGQDLLSQRPDIYGLSYGGLRRPVSPASYMYKMPGYADGGIATLKEGGDPSDYPRKNGHISGPGGPKDDKIPAMLSDGEFVFTAKAVRNMGNGSRRKGAKKMYALMKALEKRAI